MSIEKEFYEWAAELNHRVYREWKSNYPDWRPGFRVLYGSPILKPTLAIISLNPSGGEDRFKELSRYESGDFSQYRDAPYCGAQSLRSDGTRSPMSGKIQHLFGSHVEMLYYATVAFHVCFFRSRKWPEIPTPTKQKMKQFCFPIVKEITEKFQPRSILVIGFDTCGYLERILGSFTGKTPTDRNMGHRLIEESIWESEWGTVPIFAVVHLTGARPPPSNEERRIIRDGFHEWVMKHEPV